MLSETEVIRRSSENGFDYLSGYSGIYKPARFRCQSCSDEFSMQAQFAIYGIRRCPSCRTGGEGYCLTETFFENHPELKKAPCNFYLFKLRSEDEEFWKIGVTRRPIKERIRQLPYEVVEHEYVETTFWRAFQMEKSMRQVIEPYRYEPKTDFGGWTECFQPTH